MGETADQSMTCLQARTEQGDTGCCAPQRLLETFADDTARRIYLFLEEPATVAEISDECGVPGSTAYRKVDDLHDAGLVAELEHPAGGVATQYVQAMDRVVVTYENPIRIKCVKRGFSMHSALESSE